MLHLYNTRTRQQELFEPMGDIIGLYTCGPTVYNYAHIGNMRSFVMADILKRTLLLYGYRVNHVMNITDVGHLTDDADAGEDKMEKGARREGKTAWEVAQYYTEAFHRDAALMHILPPTTECRATEHIYEQIAQVETLIDKGFTYETSDGIYFDTTRDPHYGEIANLANQELEAGARVEMREKRNPHDFALWKFTRPGETRQMEWEAFGRKGFPGWHIECSAMSMRYLGDHFDIHTGGIDHIPVHHTNEIAQAEATLGERPWVRYWVHNEFINVRGEKMAKSGENFITVQTLVDKGYDPLAYRFLLLQSHYRKEMSFTWEAMDAAAAGLRKLRRDVGRSPETGDEGDELFDSFRNALSDDLNTASALAALFTGLREGRVSQKLVSDMDGVLGLDLLRGEEPADIPKEVQELLDEREKAREERDWGESDRLREALLEHGFWVEDTSEGQVVTRNT